MSESSVYRILKAEGLIANPAFILMKAADRFQNPTSRINELWQTVREAGVYATSLT